MLSHEGVSEGRRGYMGLGPSHARRQGRMIRASGVRMIRMESRMIRLQVKPSGVFDAVSRTIRGRVRMIRPLTAVRTSGLAPAAAPSSSSPFFRLLFHASLVDGVVVPWCLHSSSTSVKLRQYLCMPTGEVDRKSVV